MSIFGSFFGTDDIEDKTINKNIKTDGGETEEGTLQLRKEELDINKSKVQTGEVILSKEVVEEQQTVNVPVTHEEVVIERRTLNNQPTDSQISSTNSSLDLSFNSISENSFEKNNCETIRIPVTEEKVEVGKHTVVTEEISAHKRNVEETQKVDETLRREEARVDKNGNPVITNDDASSDDNISNDIFQ